MKQLAVFSLCALMLSIGADSALSNQGNSQGHSQGKGNGKYKVKGKGKKQIILTAEGASCRQNKVYIKRHVRRIVQQEATSSNMSGPVRVTSSVVTCGPGDIMTLAARCTVNRVRYTLHCELRPTGKNPNSPVGWDGSNHRWENATRRVVIEPTTTTPTSTRTTTRPSR